MSIIQFSFLVSFNSVLKFSTLSSINSGSLVTSTIDELTVVTFSNTSFLYWKSSSRVFSTPYCIPKDIEVISPYSMITELICFKQSCTVCTNSCLSSLLLNSHRDLNHFIICCISQELKKYQLQGMTWTLYRDARITKIFFSSPSAPEFPIAYSLLRHEYVNELLPAVFSERQTVFVYFVSLCLLDLHVCWFMCCRLI